MRTSLSSSQKPNKLATYKSMLNFRALSARVCITEMFKRCQILGVNCQDLGQFFVDILMIFRDKKKSNFPRFKAYRLTLRLRDHLM